jgi:ribosomal protein S18 acetylase RimI-like enzyme
LNSKILLTQLDEIFLNPINRHKGYAESFVNWLDEEFSFAAALSLEVLPENKQAIRFYEKAGFVPDGYISYDKKIKK